MANKTSARPRRSPQLSTARGRIPTRTTPRGRPGKFSAPSPSRLPGRRKPTESKSGVKGALTSALSALPSGGSSKKSKGRKVNVKANAKTKGAPALAVLAAGAGAVLGRKQLAKRKENNNAESVSETPAVPVVDSTATTSAP